MQVLDETLNATRLMSCVTPDLRSRRSHVADLVGPEVTDTLLQHVELLADYNAQLGRCGGEPKSNDMVDVTLRLQDSVRTLSRLPGQHPGLVDKLMVMAMDTDMQRFVARGVHTLEGLKHITFQKLITTVEQENSRYVACAHPPHTTKLVHRCLTEPAVCRQNFISGIERKEQQKQKERKDLETRLKAEKESRQKEVKRLTDQRDKLLGARILATLLGQSTYHFTQLLPQLRSMRSTTRTRQKWQNSKMGQKSRRSSTKRITMQRCVAPHSSVHHQAATILNVHSIIIVLLGGKTHEGV